jgi:hypothetical protein
MFAHRELIVALAFSKDRRMLATADSAVAGSTSGPRDRLGLRFGRAMPSTGGARMAEIRGIQRVAGGGDTYEVVIAWSDGSRTYVVNVTDEDGIRGVRAPDETYPEIGRSPFLAKYLLPLVLSLHDGQPISLPVPIPEEKIH